MRRSILRALAPLLLGAFAQSEAASTITTTTAGAAYFSASKFHLHHASGHYWAVVDDGTNGIVYSSLDGIVWTSLGSIFTFPPNSSFDRWAARFSGSVLVAIAMNDGDLIRYYRKATLNWDGTLAWSGAESPVGPADGNWRELNVAITNGKPILWRDSETGDGTIWRGTNLDAPAWTKSATDAPSLAAATTGGFSAGAVLPVGGADPDDVIVLRATTSSSSTPGSHRLVSVKYDFSADAYDASWYNVSSLGGLLAEDASTRVRTGGSFAYQKYFAAVRDGAGDVHAVYVNQNNEVAHYRKTAGFNDSWSRVTANATASGGTVDKVGLTALAGGHLYLFYAKTDQRIYYRRFDGASWGSETTLKSDTTTLEDSFGTMESAAGCAVGFSWIEGAASPWDVRFAIVPGQCPELQATAGSGTITVTAPSSFELRFNEATGGAIDEMYDLVEDPARSYDEAGGALRTRGLLSHVLHSGGVPYRTSENADGAKLVLLEATPTRVRVRQDSFLQQESGTSRLGGVKVVSDYSLYPSGRAALRATRSNTTGPAFSSQEWALAVHWAGPPLNDVSGFSQTDETFPNPGSDDFLLAERNSAGVRMDFLTVLFEDWTAANGFLATADATNMFFGGGGDEWAKLVWVDDTAASLSPLVDETWNLLTYFQPTDLLDDTDPAVVTRAADYRTPSALTASVGAGWNENPADGDFFNESEGIYTLDLDPASGLTFDLNGATTNRRQPAFKIRQWRSLAEPDTLTLEGNVLVKDVDFKADVKPISDSGYVIDVLFHTTLESLAAVTTPDVGNGAGATENAMTYGAARFGSGAVFDSTTDRINIPLVVSGRGNVELDRGRIELWYRPNYDHDDNTAHYVFDLDNDGVDGGAGIRIKKENNTFANALTAEVQDNAGNPHLISVPSTNYQWRAGDWVHLALEWDSTDATDNVNLFLNGVELVPNSNSDGAFTMEAENAAGYLRLGNKATGCCWNADGIIDELTIAGSRGGPTRLAFGGLQASPSEYLASGARNLLLALTTVDVERRGRFWYLGSDSKFRGLNVALAMAGTGAPDLQWQYWNGTAWASLESVSGFTDETTQLTRDGTIFWTADPAGWSPYSLSGGPSLYYVRAYVASGSYTIGPAEGLVKTDILLLQYCGTITADNQTFALSLPEPTAVDLVSFEAEALDGAVELRWETGSEIANLGFHLYRAGSESGPFARLTPTPIAGLGSSPAGARYRYLDSGLENGRAYFYRLEDIETTGRTETHGPISATPSALAASPLRGEEEGRARLVYGSPETSRVEVRFLSRNRARIELVTPGFLAEAAEDGTMQFSIPGFEEPFGEGAALPLKRVLLEGRAGWTASIASIRTLQVETFESLRPSPGAEPELVAGRGGVVRAGRRRRRSTTEEALSAPRAKVLEELIQGSQKKLFVALSPLRWNGERLELSKRLVVEVSFLPDGVTREDSVAAPREARRRSVRARLVTRERGLYAASTPRVDGSRLRLSRHGRDVPFFFDRNEGTLYFWSEGAASNPYGHEAVFELEDASSGKTMEVTSAPPRGDRVSTYIHTDAYEENRLYQAGLLEAPDPWLWDVVLSGQSKSYSFAVVDLEKGPATVAVSLQGTSDFAGVLDHHVTASVNGVPLGDALWDGKTAERLTIALPEGVLRAGDNDLTLDNVGDAGAPYSMVMLDRFEMRYPRTAKGDLEGRFVETGTAEVRGVTPLAKVVDLTSDPRWLTGFAIDSEGTLRFRAEAGGRYAVISAPLRPERRPARESRLWSERRRADMLLIGPRELLDAAAPLLAHRRRQGLAVEAVEIEEIYDAFGYGERRPEALRDFLRYAYREWSGPVLRYVLLLGDGSYDFKDYLGTGAPNHVPPLLVPTSYLRTASDPAYASVNGDDLVPDLAIGRLPAKSAAELSAMVAKILAYEERETSSAPILLVTDDADAAGDFPADASELSRTVLAPFPRKWIRLDELGRDGTRSALLSSLDEGASILSYLGHGGIHVWAHENVFEGSDASLLNETREQPILFTMNCLNGYFHFPYFDSLAEAMVKAEGKGAIAAFSPSGLSWNEAAHRYHRALLSAVLGGEHARLGDAVLEAQEVFLAEGIFPELVTIYHLFGDPALRLRR